MTHNQVEFASTVGTVGKVLGRGNTVGKMGTLGKAGGKLKPQQWGIGGKNARGGFFSSKSKGMNLRN